MGKIQFKIANGHIAILQSDNKKLKLLTLWFSLCTETLCLILHYLVVNQFGQVVPLKLKLRFSV